MFLRSSLRQHPIYGPSPQLLVGETAPEGAKPLWARAGIGTRYVRRSGAQTETYLKVSNKGRDSDWLLVEGVIAERLRKADFSASGNTGTYTFAEQIPVNATVLYAQVLDVTAFSGDSTATVQIGDTSTMPRYSTGTPSVFTDAAYVDVGAVSGTAYHSAAAQPRVRVTTTASFASVVSTAALSVRIVYRGR